MNLIKTASAALFALATSLSGFAVPISGEIFFAGSGTLDAPATTATSVAFSPNVIIYDEISTGNYGGLGTATTATFSNFTFGGAGTIGALPVTPLWSFTDGGKTFSFSLMELTLNENSGSQRNLEGWGMASITGFEDTHGFWSMSTSGRTAKVSFSAYSSVPDSGATALLIVVAVAGLRFIPRRHRVIQA